MSAEVDPRTRRRLPPEARRAHLLDAAGDLVARDGIGAVTMERVAEEAGVSRGLVYNYFDNAESIVRAIHETEVAVLQEATDAAVEAAGDDLRTLVEQVSRAWMDRFYERGPLLAALFSPQPPDSPLADVERARGAATHRMWTAAYASATGVDDRTAADLTAMLLYAFSGALNQLAVGRTPDQLTETYVELAMGALDRFTRRRG